jgi:RNase_H superfamily
MDEADAIVHYNGNKFDIPTLNKEFILEGMSPPSPARQIDLLRVCRSRFRFPSNKLDYVAQRLGLGEKKQTTFKLWVDCMNNDPKAWKKMEAYNKHDVKLLERVYDRVKPWIKGHPNHSLFESALVCPTCGGTKYQRRGYAHTTAATYARYQCVGGCGSWFQGGRSVAASPDKRFKAI